MAADSEPSQDSPGPKGESHGVADGGRRKGDGAKRAEPKDDEGDQKQGDDAKASGGKEKDAAKGDKGKPPLYKRPLVVLLVLLVLLAAILVAIVFWRKSKHHETTDDAFIDGRASAIAPQAAGRVLRLYVTDNQMVRAGDPLIDIDARDIETQAAQARAQLQSAESQLQQARAQVALQRAQAAQAAANTEQSLAQHIQAEQDLARYTAVDPEAVSRQQADSATASAREARARVDASRSSQRAAAAQIKAAQAQAVSAAASIKTARANLAAAELQLSYTHLVAPVTGRITRRSVETGNVVSVGQVLMSIVDPTMWVTANYKETQLTHLRRGMTVKIKVDAFPDVAFNGRIDSIQTATGAYFSLLPAENATGNYVKVVQRVPVKIVFDDDRVGQYAIGPGMSATPDVQLP